MTKPTLYLTVGLPGSGKTTKAKQIEKDYRALRLTPDEYILKKHGSKLERSITDSLRDEVEQKLWLQAKNALLKGINVVIDFGLWTKAERLRFRGEAEKLGIRVKIIYCQAPLEELWHRISRRPESKAGTLKIERTELEEWARNFEPPTSDELN